MQQRQLEVRGRPARVHLGGEGPALLLVHGGWGGATISWSRVWDRLARRHRVIAPELPGLGWSEQPALGTVRECALWLVALLDALGVERAWCVGSSFGGSVVWSLAGRAPGRCLGVVLVNGVPMPATPPLLLRLGQTRRGRALMRAMMRRVSYNPRAIVRAFVDPTRVPPELRRLLEQDASRLLDRFAPLVIAGDGPPAPQVTPLLLWGEGDRLLGTSVRAARKLHARLPGSTLALVPGAGHFPQLEAPELFCDHLEAFIGSPAASGKAPPRR